MMMGTQREVKNTTLVDIAKKFMECIVGEDSIELSLGGEFNLIAFFDKKILFFLSSQLELIMCYERIFSSTYNKQGHKPQSKKVINHRGAFSKEVFFTDCKSPQRVRKIIPKKFNRLWCAPKEQEVAYLLNWQGIVGMLYTHFDSLWRPPSTIGTLSLCVEC